MAQGQKKQIASNGSLVTAAGVAAVAGLAWYYRAQLMGLMGYQRVSMSAGVKAQLPIAKDLPTIPDQEANYDIDGVSFDSEGVVVSSDKQFETETTKQVRH